MRSCYALVLCLCVWGAAASENPLHWAEAQMIESLFPTATSFSPSATAPGAVQISDRVSVIGYAYETSAFVRSTGFDGSTFSVIVALDVNGRIHRAIVLKHNEPIIEYNRLDERLDTFFDQYTGLEYSRTWRIRSHSSANDDTLDGLSGATISIRAFHQAVIRSARGVAGALGLAGDKTRIDTQAFAEKTWTELLAEGAIAELRSPDPFASVGSRSSSNDPFAQVFVALVTPVTIGRNLLGDYHYANRVATYSGDDLLILVMSSGAYSPIGTNLFYSGALDRLTIHQGEKEYVLNRNDYRYIAFLRSVGAPKFREIGLLRIDASRGLDPVQPWELRLHLQRGNETKTVAKTYQLPASYMAGTKTASSPPEPVAMDLRLALWSEQWARVSIVLLGLFALTAALIKLDWWTAKRARYLAFRITFLLLVLVWLGWYAGAQLSIVHLRAWWTALSGGDWIGALQEPLIAVIAVFTILSLVVWGRGVFCGWLCPFGALQELLAKLARLVRIPAVNFSHKTNQRLRPLKFVVLGAIVVSAIGLFADWSVEEVEPFKTVISTRFDRSWPYVMYAVAILGVGLFVERAFCRFLCPLGAAMVIGGLFSRGAGLRRRAECGNPCQLCARRCPVQAIEPDGRINMNECFHCLDCQAIYHDVQTCPPLVNAGKRVRREVPQIVVDLTRPASAK